MTRRQKILPHLEITALFFLTVVLSACGGEKPRPALEHGASPNIILISLDTLRADHLGLYGYERDTSPNLDALGREAVVFEQAMAQASSTLPSHMSLLQSRYASATTDDAPMLAEILRDHGYRTAGFTGSGNVAGELGFGRGFDTYFEARESFGRMQDVFSEFEGWVHGYAAAKTAQTAPFFLFLHTYEIHHPYTPPKPHNTAFFPDYEGTITGKRTAKLLNKIRRVHQFTNFKGTVEVNATDRKQVKALYDGGIRYTDTYMGRLREVLESLELWDNTIIVVLSDHGEEFWEHGSVLHSFTLYQEVIHVPLIMRLPQSRAGGKRIAAPVRLMDVVPTLLDLLQIPSPSTLQGRSLLPLVDDADASTTTAPQGILSEVQDLKTWIAPPWKLIIDQKTKSAELFHLGDDPLEQQNLNDREPERVVATFREMARILGGTRTRTVRDVAENLPDNEALREQLRALGYIQ